MICSNYGSFREIFGTGSGQDVDGYKRFGVKRGDYTLTAGAVFSNPFSIVFPYSFSVHDINDVVAGTDEYHWWMSEPAQATGAPRLELQRHDPSAYVTRSGRIRIALTAAGTSFMTTYDAQHMDQLLRNVHIYCIAATAPATVYWFDLHRSAFAPGSF